MHTSWMAHLADLTSVLKVNCIQALLPYRWFGFFVNSIYKEGDPHQPRQCGSTLEGSTVRRIWEERLAGDDRLS